MRASVLKMANIYLFILFVGVNSAPSNMDDMKFLQNYGYMKEMHITGLSKAVKMFQEMLGMQATGYINEDVRNVMHAARCGMATTVTIDSKWTIENITYKITQYPKIPPKINIDETIQRAFDTWGDVTNLRFQPRKRNYRIEIKFVSEQHGDGYPFDGPYNIIGHALPPSQGGSIHFDDDEEWSLDATGVDLYQSAIHEIGHSLGLGHVLSTENDSVMFPLLIRHRENFTLPEFDVKLLQSLYEVRSSSFITRSPCSSCIDPRFNTIFRTSKKITYVFVNDKYLKFNENMKLVSTGLVNDRWKNLPANIDAATETKAGQMLFFKGNQYWKYSNQNVDQDYPKLLKTFYGVPDNIETVLRWNKQFIFFQGGDIYKYIPGGRGSAIKSTIKAEFNIDTKFINAAVVLEKSILFFKSTKYFEYNLETKTSTEKLIEDYFKC